MDHQKLPLSTYMNVVISDDKLTARLQFIHDHPDFSCTVNELEDFLKQNGVKYGIHHDVLSKIANEANKNKYNLTVIAAGVSPQDGEDGSIRYLFELDGVRKPQQMEDGTVNLREVATINNVRKGQLIAERELAKEGTDGIAVTGDPIPAKKGKEARFKIGKNVVCDAEQLKMYAVIDGMITLTDKDKINVFPVYEVQGDVDYKVGNIDFVGNVVIHGNVLTGFRVKADGDIRVIGGVEGAEILAEGSIEITAGILGHNKGLVKARRNVKSSFIQEGNVEAGEDILVSQSIMHSNIRAGRNIICEGSKGLIVGGLLQAGEQVKARVIGNTMSTPTVIEVGVLPELRNELNELRLKLKEIIDNSDKTNKALAILDQLALAGQLSQDKLALRSKLARTKSQLERDQAEARDRILEIEKSLEDTSRARVDVTNIIYSGCKIVIGRYTRFVKDPTQRVYFRMADGEIAMISGV